jgi:hypothetical protein
LSGLAIGGMIAGMMGLGMAQRRRVWTIIRRLVVSTTVAGLTVLIGSRVNRALPAEPGLSAGPAVADERLRAVRIDVPSLPGLIAAVNAAAGRERVRLDPRGLKAVDMAVGPGDTLVRDWQDVRIGDLLAAGARQALHDGAIDWREQDGVIVVGRPGPLECRVYDVRDFADEARAWVASLPDAPRATGPLSGGFMLQRVEREPTIEDDVAALVMQTIQPSAWDDVAGPWFCRAWGGRLIVLTSARGHCYVESLLMMLRHSGPGQAGVVGGGR